MLSHEHPELKNARYVVFVNAGRRYVDASEEVCGLLGYTRDELLRKTIDDISYDVSKVPELFELYRSRGDLEGEFILQRKDRTPLLIHYRAFVFNDGCNAAIWEPIRDWREPYYAALLEIDPRTQKEKIDQAIVALRQDRNADNATQKVMNDALLMLNALRKMADKD